MMNHAAPRVMCRPPSSFSAANCLPLQRQQQQCRCRFSSPTPLLLLTISRPQQMGLNTLTPGKQRGTPQLTDLVSICLFSVMIRSAFYPEELALLNGVSTPPRP